MSVYTWKVLANGRGRSVHVLLRGGVAIGDVWHRSTGEWGAWYGRTLRDDRHARGVFNTWQAARKVLLQDAKDRE